MIDISVKNPTFWWRAAAADLSTHFVSQDPDVADGSPRYADRNLQRWDLVAAGVADVSAALAAHDWTPDPDVDQSIAPARAVVQIQDHSLSALEHNILQSWFAGFNTVSANPWWQPIHAGRRRLWNTLPYLQDVLVPIHGEQLYYANEEHRVLEPLDWAKGFQQNLNALHAVTWFTRRDPVNTRYVDAMTTAASNEIPEAI